MVEKVILHIEQKVKGRKGLTGIDMLPPPRIKGQNKYSDVSPSDNHLMYQAQGKKDRYASMI